MKKIRREIEVAKEAERSGDLLWFSLLLYGDHLASLHQVVSLHFSSLCFSAFFPSYSDLVFFFIFFFSFFFPSPRQASLAIKNRVCYQPSLFLTAKEE